VQKSVDIAENHRNGPQLYMRYDDDDDDDDDENLQSKHKYRPRYERC